MVPITVAAALAGTAIALVLAATGFDRPDKNLVLALVLIAGIGIFALAIDRRALLVSALAYVLFALTLLFREFGAVSSQPAS